MEAPEPQSQLPRRLAQCWLAEQERPLPAQEPFCTGVACEQPFDVRPSVEGVVAAASCLLGVHWEMLAQAAMEIVVARGEDDACAAVSVLLAASYRETVPPPQAAACHDQVVRAVSFLVACDKALLTAAARHVLLNYEETPGERWVMEVIKTAFRHADCPHICEKLNGRCDGRYKALGFLRASDVQDATWEWLGPFEGSRWPYTPTEMKYIRAANQCFTSGR